MKRIALSLLLLTLAAPTFAGPENWTFVQSVGGLTVKDPVRAKQGWVLPIHANVSGLETIAAKPTALNSALVCERTSSTIEGRRIFITIVTGPARANASSRCPSASIGEVPPGAYGVYYRGPGEAPVSIGEVRIGL